MSRPGALRTGASVAAFLLLACTLLAVLAWPGPDTPWQPDRTLPLGVQAQGSLELIAGATATLTIAPEPFEASDWQYLTYSVEDVPESRRLLLHWNGSAGAGTARIPASGHVTIALHLLPGFEGRIESLRLLLPSEDVIPPAGAAAGTASFSDVALLGGGWQPALSALRTRWTTYRPWTGQSINAAGRELPGEPGPSLVLSVALLALSAALLMRLAGVRLARAAVFAAVAGWGLLHAHHLFQLGQRSASAAVAAETSQRLSLPLAAQPSLAEAAGRLAIKLRKLETPPRVLTYGSGDFLRQYLPYLLREFDVAMMFSLATLPRDERLEGVVLVLAGSGNWTFDASRSELLLVQRRLAAEPVLITRQLQAFRIQPADARR